MNIFSLSFNAHSIRFNGRTYPGNWVVDSKMRKYIFVTSRELPRVIYRLFPPSIVTDPDNGRPASFGFDVPWRDPYAASVASLIKGKECQV